MIQQILTTNLELVRMLEGEPLTYVTDEGTVVRIKLGTAEELMAWHEELAEKNHTTPLMTPEQAQTWSQPIEPLLASVEGVQV